MSGYYGIGLSCRPCPRGGICPGGNRMWAEPGFWTTGEGLIVECIPAEKCPGGFGPSCSEGYEGDFCARCSAGYYEENDICLACSSGTSQGLLIAVTFAFLGAYVLALVFFGNSTVGNIQFVLLNLRTMWVVQVSGSSVPSVVQSVFSVLSLFAGDLNFVNPGCSGISDFPTLYFLNISVFAAVLAPLLLGLQIRHMIVRARHQRMTYRPGDTRVRDQAADEAQVSIFFITVR